MEKLKLKSGREISIKDISLDERDEMLDSVEYTYDDKGNVSGVKMMQYFLAGVQVVFQRLLEGELNYQQQQI